MEVVLTVAVLLVTTLAWLAYNHPTHYRYAAYVCGAAHFVLSAFGGLVMWVTDKNIELVKKSGIPQEHIEIVVKALTDTSNIVQQPWYRLFYVCYSALPFYLLFLFCLPLMGLTAEAREAATREPARRKDEQKRLWEPPRFSEPPFLPPRHRRRG